MKKKLFKTHLLSFTAFCGLALAFASCANEDVAQGTTGTETDNDKNLTTFVAGDEAKTRTSMDYTSGNFYWEAGDYIYVKDDNNVWRKSSNAPTGKESSFKFKVPGKFTKGNTYKVYYPGKNGSNDQVTIPAAQTQKAPNTTDHIGVSGDCGTATASWASAKNSFAFTLDHQAAVLVFQPYTSNTVLKDCYLTKVEVSSDDNITGSYSFNPTTGELTGTGSGKQIVLTMQAAIPNANDKGFPLNTTSASVTTNGAYMVIQPGTHTLKIRYSIKDVVTNVEGTITKTLSAFNYAKNTYYDMTADLNIRNYDGDHYYMWDAKKQYWDGYEWTKNLPEGQGQTTINYGPEYSITSSNYPSNYLDPRYANQNFPGVGIRYDAQQAHFKTLPNANEMAWYCMKGDARWDEDELWTAMGHLYKGGMWFLKKSKIPGYSTEHGPDGTTDLRTTTEGFTYTASKTLPDASSAGNYFYLPALGGYAVGGQKDVGRMGYYWSKSVTTGRWYDQIYAYSLYFDKDNVYMTGYDRSFGYRVQEAFE